MKRTLKFCIRVKTKRIRVWVFPTLAKLREERARYGGRGSKCRVYAFVSRGQSGGDCVHFAREYTGQNTVAHEAVHLAFNIAGHWSSREINEEKLAIATGNVAAKIVQAFYRHGVYKKG